MYRGTLFFSTLLRRKGKERSKRSPELGNGLQKKRKLDNGFVPWRNRNVFRVAKELYDDGGSPGRGTRKEHSRSVRVSDKEVAKENRIDAHKIGRVFNVHFYFRATARR